MTSEKMLVIQQIANDNAAKQAYLLLLLLWPESLLVTDKLLLHEKVVLDALQL